MTTTSLTMHAPELVATGRPLGRQSSAPILNRMLRFELAAASTYEQALRHAGAADARSAFELNRASHAVRCVVLAQLVESLGAEPASSGGTWNLVMRLVEGAAAIFHEGAAIRVLHGGEAQATEMYEEALDELDDAVVRGQLQSHLLPEQHQTERRVRELFEARGETP